MENVRPVGKVVLKILEMENIRPSSFIFVWVLYESREYDSSHKSYLFKNTDTHD